MEEKELPDFASETNTDANEQNAAFNSFGFDKSLARRNLIVSIFAFLIFALGTVFYQYHRCQKNHADELQKCEKQRIEDIERLTTKYETKIEVLYEKLIGEK